LIHPRSLQSCFELVRERCPSNLRGTEEPLASKPIMLLGNIASIVLTIAGILQAVSWTIAGATILAILSITTLAPTKLGSGTAAGHSTAKKNHSTTTETKTSRERPQEKQASRSHQTPSKPEQRQSSTDELARAAPQTRPDFQKAMAPKITPPKTIPASVSPAKPSPSKLSSVKQETLRPVPVGAGATVVGLSRPTPTPPRIDPNTRIIAKGDYATYDVELNQRAEVTCEVTATAPVNVYLMDKDNLDSLDLGEEFWSETGEESVQKATLHFVAPQSGRWFLVVENADNKEVSAIANIRKSAARTPSTA
jgi:hypothetical protein